jgi:hypothetical protein
MSRYTQKPYHRKAYKLEACDKNSDYDNLSHVLYTAIVELKKKELPHSLSLADSRKP